MVWMNKAFRTWTTYGTLLVWNHDDVIYDCPKGEIWGKGFQSQTHSFGEIRMVVGTL
jgi:hypothetical protein